MWELISMLDGTVVSSFSDFAQCQAELLFQEYVSDGLETFSCSVRA